MNNTKASSNPKADTTNAAANANANANATGTDTAVSTNPGSAPRAPIRHLVLVLGDQLDIGATALEGFDPAQDQLWMAEVAQESEHVWSAKQRTTVFLSAMRHFAAELRAKSWPLHYVTLDAPDNSGTLAGELAKAIATYQPQTLVMTAPGDWRVLQDLRGAALAAKVPMDVRDDLHFFSTVRDFAAHAKGRKQLRLEYWYRELRQKTGILMDGKAPVGGQWNFDADNRASFGAKGPARCRRPRDLRPTPPRKPLLRWSTRALPATPAAWPNLAGRSRGRRRCWRWTHSFKSACHFLANTQTRCGRAMCGSTTRTWPAP